jgi:predicted PhzF superfamily epimerase YddE/YHI9
MKDVPYWHVDAFADRPFAGNQAAVMILDAWPEDAVLQAISAENNFPATAFLVPGPNDEDLVGKLRWFSPTVEIRLCGHATLASGHALLNREPDREAVRFRTRKAGVVEVLRRGDGYELALPAIPTAPDGWSEAVAALGAVPSEVWRSPDGYDVFLYENAAQIRGLRPDFRALAALGNHTIIATASGDQTDIVSRVFVPGAGIDEDSVTGVAHAVLTPFWAPRLGRDSFSAYQASARGGHLTCRLDGDRVWLGGRCVTLAEGRFYF